MVEIFIHSFRIPPMEIVLDFDATEDEVHGHQENRHFHGYYNCYCFLPLHVFCGEQLLISYLRPSNIDGAKHTWAILSLLVKRIRKSWPKVTRTNECGCVSSGFLVSVNFRTPPSSNWSSEK